MTVPTEDDDYLISGAVDEFAIADEEALDDEDGEFDTEQVVNSGIIKEIQQYCTDEIASGNTFDILNIPQNATDEQKLAVFNEIAIHKGVTMHLRNIQTIITNKVKEN